MSHRCVMRANILFQTSWYWKKALPRCLGIWWEILFMQYLIFSSSCWLKRNCTMRKKIRENLSKREEIVDMKFFLLQHWKLFQTIPHNFFHLVFVIEMEYLSEIWSNNFWLLWIFEARVFISVNPNVISNFCCLYFWTFLFYQFKAFFARIRLLFDDISHKIVWNILPQVVVNNDDVLASYGWTCKIEAEDVSDSFPWGQ